VQLILINLSLVEDNGTLSVGVKSVDTNGDYQPAKAVVWPKLTLRDESTGSKQD
jgi:hypothetical protein